MQREYKKGRGAQMNTRNRFERQERTTEHVEGIDEWVEAGVTTQFIDVQARSIVNKVDSPDVPMFYSMNPYMGCEHGCIYCYARNSFEYWGYSAGLDFESKILVKQNAPELLRKFLMNPKWKCVPISISGNTDCYQPAEQKFRLTRKLLEVCNEFNQPVGIITKNAAILRDIDLLKDMASRRLVSVFISLTTLNEELRRVMEPRTTTALQRLRVIEELSKVGVQMGLMLGPIIPGLNEHEMPAVIKAAVEAGATFSGYTFVRLNGAVKVLFHDWLYKNFPDRADKVWHMIESGHGGKVNDSRWGVRMRGEGNIAKLVADQYRAYTKKYGLGKEKMALDCTRFNPPVPKGESWEQSTLF
ncbi:PA0069 family radical SAM protein [Chitinophagaceae bacterium LB-8]|uniref:PA0069 family radical SAM protein n=1 Tax=Paraflavisolibacter caeni TaxID=2982496 RepID=A0A9X3BGP1_9BACT|nr:PA0069 family radical SAM protein [Paraflavisolibacter caeni]MCU7551274.1 PA0069 family radical SAM protein [Paraflavisolibacter caeni]